MVTVTLEQALASGHGEWRSFTCPEHPDANPSARVNVVSGKWVCMVCHARGDSKGYVVDPIVLLDQAMAMLEDVDLTKPESWLDQFDSGPVHEYWTSRFTEEACRTYRLGWDGTRGKPCYPIRDISGQPLGVVHRNVDDPEGPKYKYPRGVSTSRLLFGLRELDDVRRLFIVEGAMDVVAVREAGHDAVGTYGSRLYPEQLREIVALHPGAVILAYDMDSAGHLGAKEARWALQDEGILVRRPWWNARYKDLGEMPLEKRRSTLEKILASISTEG